MKNVESATALPKRKRSGPAITKHQGVKIFQTTTILAPVEEMYRFWRNLENLPKFIRHLESVRVKEDRFSHWIAKAPAGMKLEWDAEIINDKEPSLIAWQSCEGSGLRNAGTVRFKAAPRGRGAEVTVVWEYIPPAGKLGKALAKFWGEDPEDEIREDLRRLKAYLETGEIPSIAGQSSARLS